MSRFLRYFIKENLPDEYNIIFYQMGFIKYPALYNEYDNKFTMIPFVRKLKIKNLIDFDGYKQLTSLIIERYNFDQKVNQLPQSLTHLTIRGYKAFNQEVNQLPLSLTYLEILGYNFNQEVNQLPLSLTKLRIGGKELNQEVNQLPRSLTHLTIEAYNFNQQVNQLPPSLTQLRITGYNFNQQVNQLPQSLIKLEIPKRYNGQLDYLSNTEIKYY
jgi:hypothetical protein